MATGVAADTILNITNTLNIEPSAILNISNRSGATISAPTGGTTSLFYDTDVNEISYINTIDNTILQATGPTGDSGSQGFSDSQGSSGPTGNINTEGYDYVVGTASTSNEFVWLTILNIPTVNNTSYTLQANIVGFNSDDTSQYSGYELISAFRNVSSTLTKNGGDSTTSFRNAGTLWFVRSIVSGINIAIQIIVLDFFGNAGDVINWKTAVQIVTSELP
jgi:hypothetical protein